MRFFETQCRRTTNENTVENKLTPHWVSTDLRSHHNENQIFKAACIYLCFVNNVNTKSLLREEQRVLSNIISVS